MNPFQLHADMMRLWMELAGQAVQATSDICQTVARQQFAFVNAMSAPAGVGLGAQMPNWFPWASPSASLAWPSTAFATPNPFTAFMPFAALVPPSQPAWAPFQMMPFSAALMQPWAGSGPFAMASMWAAPLAAFGRPRDPVSELVEQATAAYRSASGYAVAAVLAPINDTAGRANSQATPWWQVRVGKHGSN